MAGDPASTPSLAPRRGHEWLRYDKELGDFVFEVDWRFTPRGEGETRYNSVLGARLSQLVKSTTSADQPRVATCSGITSSTARSGVSV